jgi:hypothetical protein
MTARAVLHSISIALMAGAALYGGLCLVVIMEASR